MSEKIPDFAAYVAGFVRENKVNVFDYATGLCDSIDPEEAVSILVNGTGAIEVEVIGPCGRIMVGAKTASRNLKGDKWKLADTIQEPSDELELLSDLSDDMED